MFGLVFGFVIQIESNQVHAAGGDGATSDISLLDTDADGVLDRITFRIANPNTETWSLTGLSPHGLQAQWSGSDVTINSVSITSAADANPVLIQVDLDESDADLLADTSNTNLELGYVQGNLGSNCTTEACITDDTDEEMNAIVLGSNTGPTNIENDGAAPVIAQFRYKDRSGDGIVDRVQLRFTETITAASSLARNDLLITNVGDFTDAAFGGNTDDLVTGSLQEVNINLGTDASVVDTYDDTATFAISTQNGFSITDGTNTNSTLGAQTQASVRDRANPVITSTTPTDDTTVQSRTNSVVFNFSEPMVTTFAEGTQFESTPDPGNWSATASNGDETITLTHNNFLCITDYVITTTEAFVLSANGDALFKPLIETGPFDGTLSFTTMSCGSEFIEAPEYSLEVDDLSCDAQLLEGDEYEITWSSSHDDQYYIDLFYTDSSGEYVEIATNESNDESYTWIVPEDLDSTTIKVVWQDLADEIDSGEVELTCGDQVVDDQDDQEDGDQSGDGELDDEEEEEVEVEEGEFSEGDLLRLDFSPIVYHVTSEGTRRPFADPYTYFTHYDSFEGVQVVSTDQISQLEIGMPMMPAPGIVLVKTPSNPQVFAINEAEELQWVVSEELAIVLFGDNWADYVIDINSAILFRFTKGQSIVTIEDWRLEGKEMKRRIDLAG